MKYHRTCPEHASRASAPSVTAALRAAKGVGRTLSVSSSPLPASNNQLVCTSSRLCCSPLTALSSDVLTARPPALPRPLGETRGLAQAPSLLSPCHVRTRVSWIWRCASRIHHLCDRREHVDEGGVALRRRSSAEIHGALSIHSAPSRHAPTSLPSRIRVHARH